jgi:hypothetical protein
MPRKKSRPVAIRKSQREKKLESIIIDLYWMARRYADGRMSYAPSMCNDAIRLAIKLGVPIGDDSSIGGMFARDGMESTNEETTIGETTGC